MPRTRRIASIAVALLVATSVSVLTDRSAVAAPTGSAAAPPHNPLLNQVLAGEDEDQELDPADLSALCRTYIGRPNPYRNPSPNVNQINGDAIAQTASQAGCHTAQNETTIAVNPYNPANIVAGANDYRVFNTREQRNDSSGYAYTSFDGGRTWRDIQLPHLTYQTGATGPLSIMDGAGDPVIAFGPHNTVYYANIDFSRAAPAAGGTEAPNAITLNVSHDGGLHWSEPVIVRIDGVDSAGTPTPTNYFNDKVWLAADKFSGRVYVTWTRFKDAPDGSYLESPIVIASSSNYGKSFSQFRRVDVPATPKTPGLVPYSQGSNPQVARDGTLYIAYEGEACQTLACDQPTDRDVTVVATSHNHGRTFTRSIVDTNYDFPFDEDTGDAGLTDENFRINSFPQLAYDPIRDRLAVVWNDDRNGSYDPTTGESVRTNGDNIVATSRDGKRWSRPQVFGSAQDEVFAAITSFAGVTAVTAYTRKYAPTGINLDYAYWTARRHSNRFGSAHRITTQSQNPQVQFVSEDEDGNPIQGVFIGDYSAVSMGSDLVLHPSWTDFRGRPGRTEPNQDAYTQAIRLNRR